MTYSLADPDDGSCETHSTAVACTREKSSLNPNESMCYWHSGVESAEGKCLFRPISDDLVRVVTVAIIAAIISAPLSLLVQWTINNILSRDTVRDDDVTVLPLPDLNKNDSSLAVPVKYSKKRNDGRLKFILKEQCGDTLQDDLKNLLAEISHYRRGLTGQSLQEFDGSHISCL
jgi:hypothetical protein